MVSSTLSREIPCHTELVDKGVLRRTKGTNIKRRAVRTLNVVLFIATLLIGPVNYTVRAQSSEHVLLGKTGSSLIWGSGWLDLTSPIDFKKGDCLKLIVGGSAAKVLVRLLPKGSEPESMHGVIAQVISLPNDRIIEIVLKKDFPQVVQISVHGGSNPWDNFPLGAGNGPATLKSGAIIEPTHCVDLTENLMVEDQIQVSVTETVDQWQRENDISVTEAAKKMIGEGFSEEREGLNTVLSLQPNKKVLFAAMVESYLFDVRDDKIDVANSYDVGRPFTTRSGAFGFFPQITFAGNSIRIKSEDIRHLPPQEYVKRHLLDWSDKQLAVLHVISKPDGAIIKINDAYKGYTCKKFVLTEGSYRVQISPRCDVTKSVSASDPPAVISCDKISTCAHWNAD